MEKAVGKTILKVSQWHTLEMNDDEGTKVIFEKKNDEVVTVFANNLTEEKEQAWRNIARIVLLGPNYTPRGGAK